MTRIHDVTRALAALAATLVLLVAAGTSEARLLRAAQVVGPNQPMAAPAMSAPVGGQVVEMSPCGPAPCAPVCPQPCITYRHVGRPMGSCCQPPVQTMLSVKNPCSCNCCELAIPVCLPACCQGVPAVNCRHGLFACGVVTYDWCCGVRVVVRFQKSGGVIVTYHNA